MFLAEDEAPAVGHEAVMSKENEVRLPETEGSLLRIRTKPLAFILN